MAEPQFFNFQKKKVEETKQLWRVLTVFIPLPFFWALYEQQGSRWIIQANRMNGKLVSLILNVTPCILIL